MSWNLKQNERERREREAEEDAREEEYFRELRHERHSHRRPKEPIWRIYLFIILAVSMSTFGLTSYYYPELLQPRPTRTTPENLPSTFELTPSLAVSPQLTEPPTVENIVQDTVSDQVWSYVPIVVNGYVQAFFMWMPGDSINAPYLANLPLSKQLDCSPEHLIVQDIPDSAATVYLISTGQTEDVTVSIFPGEISSVTQIAFVCQPGEVFSLRWN
ncbi:hypothetical protein A3K29_03290 [Candidatus Collierbacteria bacterium RIFOXYB2_FULL_46_14]|uniref:Uncharacterized protein n=1 Tax=Candidatus Collierbacteria bacterium GW2011_GWA2_46_26 TaxID=1618381 RepID=A0A0G1PLV4_9BACT|nr:MAG: hypothetical protein UW29_C0004G0166 [Candidatus Collierbacteria bacterium GW2011_GWC2_44_13]KKU33784.1 MAG: hypothetical protein UX47_C0001G0067 [Candidatus Collierbacteria bacterium GW2011_GWA2_46_26]OGD73144.1 MAG: hypothetical protein A3K29_03290 [Candidatus Collierbacteria bacterium RIFOXYB2_FULL_46_14]OGD76186.1 MAG: hypothetical protein A3K43_03290 [Candidatus Collierbacteria bacterium RIFOXYA2_FULL_46_20]OGD77522.1 MAG: hypothetical protein A3K39_03290 [Candidatus Collierbacteri